MTRLIIARHGNTFTKDQTPTRVGGQTDLDLVETERGTNVGKYLNLKGYKPSIVFAAPLKRTRKTAELAIEALNTKAPLVIDESFREIDYGPDENKTEDEVMLRLGQNDMEKGKEIIELWNSDAIVPNGWKVDPKVMANCWTTFADKIEKEYKDQDILVVSSNGIIRFAPHITGDFKAFSSNHDLKVGTGNVCVFEKNDGDKNWRCIEWNTKPKDALNAH